MGKSIISYSKLAEWTNCRYRWKLRYIDKISPRKDYRPPTLGNAVHQGMACGMLGKDYVVGINKWADDYLDQHLLQVDNPDIIDLNNEILDMVTEVKDTAKTIVERTLKVFGPDQWEPVMLDGEPVVERELIVPIRGWGGYRGILDLVAKEKSTGFVWVIDYKVRKQLQPIEAEEVNLQMGSYQYLALRHKIPTVGSIAFQILAKTPLKPKLNKDGSMSRARISTDWETYKQALIENGLDPAEYATEMKDKLDVEFWRESRAYRSELEVRNIWSEVIQKTAWDMSRKTPHYWRKMGHMNCMNCWARVLCMEELRGGDINYLLETRYTVKEEEEEEILDVSGTSEES